MRNAFAQELTQLAKEESRLVFLSGDIGNKLFDAFKAQCPDRFYNCGVAEQNMMGVAAGMAKSGLKPIVYTITPFATTRCYEQIRVDVCSHNLPVIIAGVGSGLSYASLGPTHQSCEDIALLRVLPNMTVLCPGDAMEVRATLRAAIRHSGPVYLRLGKKGEPVVHQTIPSLTIGRALEMAAGKDLCLLSTGNILPLAMDVARQLEQSKLSTRVISFHTVKPLDATLLTEIFIKYPLVVTLEEHSLLGGFGSAIAEWKTDYSEGKGKLIRFGTGDDYIHITGDQNYARARFGLTCDLLCKKILEVYKKTIL
ncbi:MAG: transketolase [Deltaproteobacteria bacterium RIFCSPLOWO2_02_FULL_46_8]|nr:MAG: transketolase [Deltaproteobacteria bacterium RIFCSPLOWO2_02_FULL_46_8]